jgi:hypothetical protein
MDGPTQEKPKDISDRLIGHTRLTHPAFAELCDDMADRSEAATSRLRELLKAAAGRIRDLTGAES